MVDPAIPAFAAAALVGGVAKVLAVLDLRRFRARRQLEPDRYADLDMLQSHLDRAKAWEMDRPTRQRAARIAKYGTRWT